MSFTRFYALMGKLQPGFHLFCLNACCSAAVLFTKQDINQKLIVHLKSSAKQASNSYLCSISVYSFKELPYLISLAEVAHCTPSLLMFIWTTEGKLTEWCLHSLTHWKVPVSGWDTRKAYRSLQGESLGLCAELATIRRLSFV